MKRDWSFARWAAFFCAALVIAACGGGGGGGGGTSGGSSGGGNDLGSQAPEPGNYIEFVSGRSDVVMDPLNMVPGTSFQLKAVNYDVAGNRTVLPAGSWSLFGADGSQVSLSSTGVLQAIADTPGIFGIACVANVGGVNTNLNQDARVTSGTTVLTGRLVPESTSVIGVKYVQIEVFNASRVRVGGGLTGDDGRFRIVLPSNATGISAKASTIPTNKYYRALKYNNRYYTPDGSTCAIVLPTISAGAVNTMPQNIQVAEKSMGPPPPPGGCGGN